MVARKKSVHFIKAQVIKAYYKGIRPCKINELINSINGDLDQVSFCVSLYLNFHMERNWVLDNST